MPHFTHTELAAPRWLFPAVVGCWFALVGGCANVMTDADLADAGPAETDTEEPENPDWEEPTADPICEQPATASGGKRIRAVYIVPSDRTPSPQYVDNIADTMGHIQRWLASQTRNGESIAIADENVEVVVTNRPAADYNSVPAGSYGPDFYFWRNGLDDAFELTGADHGDPDDVWLFFVDAPVTCSSRLGATNGVALFSARDLDALAGKPMTPACGVDATAGRCRAVGVVLNNLLTALRVPDPAACTDDDDTTTCPDELATTWGHLQFPNAELAPEQVDFLEQSGFARAVDTPACDFSCAEPVMP